MMDANITQALGCIPPDIERESWYRILAALKSELGEAGEPIARNWSEGGENYKKSDFDSTWKSLNGNGGITIGTMFHIAKGYGFRPEKTSDHQKPREAAQDASETHSMVAMKCAERWAKATPAQPDHPYLMKKDVGPHGIKQEGENLLIPMLDESGNIWSLQTITPDGQKYFAKGSRTKGLYFRIKGNGPVVIAEGYATAVSIYEATGFNVAVAFSCHNLGTVAKTIRAKLPDTRIIIAADREPTSTTQKAQKVALSIGADLAVPCAGADFNDLCQLEGLEAVRTQIDGAPPHDDGRWRLPGPITTEEWTGARLTPVCIVEKYLYADVAVLIAPGGTGKTTLILSEAIHIVLGRPLYGLKVHKPGPVVVLTAEDPREMLVARLRRISEYMMLSEDEIEVVRRQILIVDVSGKGMRLIEAGEGAIRPTEFTDLMIHELSDLNPVLVVIDPSVSFGIGESRINDNEQGLVEAGRRIRVALNCCIRFIHHTGKQSAKDKETNQYAGRGGSAFADGCRMVHIMHPLDGGEWRKLTGTEYDPTDTGMVLARPKMSYDPPQPEILIRRRGYLFEHVEQAAHDPAAVINRNADTVWLFIDSELKAGRKHSKNSLEAVDIGMSRTDLRRAFKWLEEHSRIESRDIEPKPSRGLKVYLHPVASPDSTERRTENGSNYGIQVANDQLGPASPPPLRKEETANRDSPDSSLHSFGSRRTSGEATARRANRDTEAWEVDL